MKCTSCNVEFSEGVQFNCPSCSKHILARCSKCKRLAAPYECKCKFKGP